MQATSCSPHEAAVQSPPIWTPRQFSTSLGSGGPYGQFPRKTVELAIAIGTSVFPLLLLSPLGIAMGDVVDVDV